METLFSGKARQAQYIPARLKPPFLCDQLRFQWHGPIHAIWDKVRLPVIGCPEISLHLPAEHDDLIRVIGSHPFSKPDKTGCQRSPFPGPLPVKTVDRRDRPYVQDGRDPEKCTRSLRVIMDNIIILRGGIYACQKRVHQGCEAFSLYRRDRNDMDSVRVLYFLMIEFRAGYMVPAPVICIYAVPLFHKAPGDLFHYHLHAAFPAEQPLVPDLADPQFFLDHRHKKPTSERAAFFQLIRYATPKDQPIDQIIGRVCKIASGQLINEDINAQRLIHDAAVLEAVPCKPYGHGQNQRDPEDPALRDEPQKRVRIRLPRLHDLQGMGGVCVSKSHAEKSRLLQYASQISDRNPEFFIKIVVSACYHIPNPDHINGICG